MKLKTLASTGKIRKRTISIVILGMIAGSYFLFTQSNSYVHFYFVFDDLISDEIYEIPIPVKVFVDEKVILDTVITQLSIVSDFIISEQKKGFHTVKVSIYDNPPFVLSKPFFFLKLHYYSIGIYHDKRVDGKNHLKWHPWE